MLDIIVYKLHFTYIKDQPLVRLCLFIHNNGLAVVMEIMNEERAVGYLKYEGWPSCSYGDYEGRAGCGLFKI